ncbi:MAG: S8 family serine peptidase [Bacteroidia bacterium]|nr:S8 family serine peptidase [Bacteroidia bacterium]
MRLLPMGAGCSLLLWSVCPAQPDPALLARMQAAPDSAFHVLVWSGAAEAPGKTRQLRLAPVQAAQASGRVLLDWSAAHPGLRMAEDARILPEAYEDAGPAPLGPGGREPGLDAIAAPALWQMGYTGYGRTVLLIDVGVDASHPALQGSFRGLDRPAAEAWYDPLRAQLTPAPCLSDHGTHVLGSIVGLDPATQDTVGAAMGARWMAANLICLESRLSDLLAVFEWALDPDSDPATTDRPDVINCSWRLDTEAECTQELLIAMLDTLEAAGAAVVFSAGNSGPGAASITPPKNLIINPVNPFTVGALNASTLPPALNLLGFSSQGPSQCGGEGSLAIKPEVAAPGFLIRSATYSGGYNRKTGTSMAAAYVSGALLLLGEAFPQAGARELKTALYASAMDLGDPGEDNAYGNGLIRLDTAFQWMLDRGWQPALPARDPDLAIEAVDQAPARVCGPLRPRVRVRNAGSTAVPQAALHYRYSSGLSGTLPLASPLLPGQADTLELPAAQFPPGAHTLTLTLAGPAEYRAADNRRVLRFEAAPQLPAVPAAEVCVGGQALLELPAPSGLQTYWFDAEAGGEPAGAGSPWLAPAAGVWHGAWLEQAVIRPLQPAGSAAAPPQGAGLLLEAQVPARLEGIEVQAEGSGLLTLRLIRDGLAADSLTAAVVPGVQEIPADWLLLPGQQCTLRLESAVPLRMLRGGRVLPASAGAGVTVHTSTLGRDVWPGAAALRVRYEAGCARSPVWVTETAGGAQAAMAADSSAADQGVFQFSDLSTGAVSRRWDFGDGTGSIDAQPVHTYAQPGRYRVSLEAMSAAGCTDAVQAEVQARQTALGLLPAAEARLQIQPNPGRGRIRISGLPQAGCLLQLFDAQGRERLRRSVPPGGSVLRIDLPAMPAGLYQLRAAGPEGVQAAAYLHIP